MSARTASQAPSLFAPPQPSKWASFAKLNEVAAKWIETNPENSFAVSLRAGVLRYGGLTERQLAAVLKAAARGTAPAPAAVTVGDVAGLVALFDKAKASGLKSPKVRAILPDGKRMTIKLAGPQSRNAGDLYASTGSGETRVYLGRVDRAGVFHPSFKAPPEALGPCVETLTAIAKDPAAAGKAYGVQTSSCSFCSLPLEDARSVSAGYGPICAERWGLPWGETSEPAF